jgi:hypothetical protein
MLGGQFGKTELAIFDLIQSGLGKKNGVFWYICPTYGMAKDIVWGRLKLSLPPQYVLKKPREDDLTVFLISGSMLVLKGADHYDTLRGVPLDGVIMDEAAMLDRAVWEDVIQLRLAKKNGFCHFYSTPPECGTNWFTELHDDAKRREIAGDVEWSAFHFTSWDNPHLDRKQLERLKASMPEYKYNREIMALPTERGGMRFPEFDFNRNIGKYQGNNELSLYLGLDSGIAGSHPSTCVWLNVDLNERMVYVTDECYRSGAIIRDVVTEIKKRNGNKKIDMCVIDPSTTKRDKIVSMREIDEWNRNGLHCIPGDNRSRGYDIVNTFLKMGRLKIDPKCKDLIWEFSHLTWEDKLNDDGTDALRYALVRINDYMYGMDMSKLRELDNVPDGNFSKNEMTMDMAKWLSVQTKDNADYRPNDFKMNWIEKEAAAI